MYDKLERGQIVSLSDFNFNSRKHEIWFNGNFQESVEESSKISFKMLINEAVNDSIEVCFSKNITEDVIANQTLFDICFTMSDRLVVAIIAEESNVPSDNNSYNVFINFATFMTRDYKEFKVNEPYACSIFFLNNEPEKISFNVALSKTIITFFK